MKPGPFLARWSLPLTCLVALLATAAVLPQQKKSPAPLQAFTQRDAMIPMRDGVRLHTLVYTPKNTEGPLPFVIVRTPYGIDGRARRDFANYLADLVKEGYIVVYQDIRGRYKSEGQFVM